jgi:hypothetical protein
VARATPIYAEAGELVVALREHIDRRVESRARLYELDELLVGEAIATSMLAIAEALHGVVYVGNANAV